MGWAPAGAEAERWVCVVWERQDAGAAGTGTREGGPAGKDPRRGRRSLHLLCVLQCRLLAAYWPPPPIRLRPPRRLPPPPPFQAGSPPSTTRPRGAAHRCSSARSDGGSAPSFHVLQVELPSLVLLHQGTPTPALLRCTTPLRPSTSMATSRCCYRENAMAAATVECSIGSVMLVLLPGTY